MRYCPQRYSQFADNLSFCLRDGTPLLDEGANSATLVMPAPAKPASSLAKYLLIGLLGIGLLAGALALLRWKSAEQPATQASAVNINPARDADDFFYVTETAHFNFLKQKGFNVALQNS
jgi:hypothetical protein